jgi:2,4-dienoyl-CoA reductase-like NADH-dependent reductase (Old Yellow Enzyme family)
MSRLFESSNIRMMELPNRFVRSATWEGMASKNGACTPQLVSLMTRLAEGRVGLIIASHAYVRQDGQAGPGQLGIYKDDLIEGLRPMTRTVHDHGGRIILQLAHAGLYAHAERTGRPPLAPSEVENVTGPLCREMVHDDIQAIVEAFGQGASRAKEAGFDGVQIHAAHGYLLSEFLSPFYNKRTDAYGGSVENRGRALLEVLKSVRTAVGDGLVVLIKMNCRDFVDGGLTLTDSLEVGEMLQREGIDGIELSGGTPRSGRRGTVRMRINAENKEAYFREEARAFRERLHVPLILVGGIRTFQLAERLVKDGYADYISMSRAFIREPDLTRRWQSGDLQKARCISCNRCFKPAGTGEGIYCVVEKREKGKTTRKNG